MDDRLYVWEAFALREQEKRERYAGWLRWLAANGITEED
jgi:hypothetical protein